jgi:hypothetical protein
MWIKNKEGRAIRWETVNFIDTSAGISIYGDNGHGIYATKLEDLTLVHEFTGVDIVFHQEAKRITNFLQRLLAKD